MALAARPRGQTNEAEAGTLEAEAEVTTLEAEADVTKFLQPPGLIGRYWKIRHDY